MARTWILDIRGLAKKVKSAGLPAAYQIKDCGANRHCPNCQYLIDNSDVSHDWPGLPAGVKFDPSDVELLDHLAAKLGAGDSESHMFIDEFIPTLEGDEGICYTHPENLPGSKKDGSSIHFFHKIANAYGNGPRKRRKIHDQEESIVVRWHKTGKTKRIMDNGNLKGFKKIMVLYSSSKGGGSKPDRCNWVMHQYHLGDSEDERTGVYVVSKIVYQPQKEIDRSETHLVTEESVDMGTVHSIPRTPNTITPDPPRVENKHTPPADCGLHDYNLHQYFQESKPSKESTDMCSCHLGEDICFHGQAVDLGATNSLLCSEILDSYTVFDDMRINNGSISQDGGDTIDLHQRNGNDSCEIGNLDNFELDSQPDLLNDLQFGSQDSVFDWLDRF